MLMPKHWSAEHIRVVGAINVKVKPSSCTTETSLPLMIMSGDVPLIRGRQWFQPLDIAVTLPVTPSASTRSVNNLPSDNCLYGAKLQITRTRVNQLNAPN
jgi:hypothetical protein